jgi:carbamoyl-phosphate synthase small subunit
MSNKSILYLENGALFEGKPFGFEGESTGEIVFNTSMTGYQEIITDPSYNSQIVLMTYPHIGNYGTNINDIESKRSYANGLIAREFCNYPSNFESDLSLDAYLKKNKIVGIHNIDTRKLTKLIRNHGSQRCIITNKIVDKSYLDEKINNTPSMKGSDLTHNVTCKETYEIAGKDKLVFVYDYGCKENILKILNKKFGLNLVVGPCDTSSDFIKNLNPDGILLSNGPGDPAASKYAIENVKKILGFKPIFGICLGHQILSLALGFDTFKLKFGHRGANHPVMDMIDGKVEITSQNHGFAVKDNNIEDVTITHINLNDKTVEGIESKKLKCFSVQYHPEASPGPHDSYKYFYKFYEML